MLDNRIKTFLDLCKTLNFTRTAENLFITQPAVTQHIRLLENEYGVKLFKFSGKAFTLTAEGEILYRYAISSRSNALGVKKELENLVIGQPSISLGATKTIGEFIMPSFLAGYVKKHPNTNISLAVDNTHNLMQQIDDGTLDFALIEGFFDTKLYEYRPFADVNFVCAAGVQTGTQDKECDFTDLLSEKLLLREKGSGTRELTEMILKENSLDIKNFKGKIEISSFSVITNMLCNNIGVSFVYEPVIREDVKKGKLKIIKLKNFSRSHQFNIVYLPNKTFNDNVLSFIKELTDFI